MSIMTLFQRRRSPPRPQTGDPVTDMTEVLLRIEAHLGELSARSRDIEKLEKRLQGIEAALKQI